MPTLSLPLTDEEYAQAAKVRRALSNVLETDLNWPEFFNALVAEKVAAL